MRIKETYVNDDEGHQIGNSGWFEPWTDDRGELFRSLRQEYGGCTGHVYRDVRTAREHTMVAFGVTVVIPARWRIDTSGWVFSRRERYEDARPYWTQEQATYIRAVWVEVEDEPAEWGWKGRQP